MLAKINQLLAKFGIKDTMDFYISIKNLSEVEGDWFNGGFADSAYNIFLNFGGVEELIYDLSGFTISLYNQNNELASELTTDITGILNFVNLPKILKYKVVVTKGNVTETYYINSSDLTRNIIFYISFAST